MVPLHLEELLGQASTLHLQGPQQVEYISLQAGLIHHPVQEVRTLPLQEWFQARQRLVRWYIQDRARCLRQMRAKATPDITECGGLVWNEN